MNPPLIILVRSPLPSGMCILTLILAVLYNNILTFNNFHVTKKRRKKELKMRILSKIRNIP